MVRDSQRKKVYEAEWYFRRMAKANPGGPTLSAGAFQEKKFRSLRGVQNYVDNVLAQGYTYRYAKRPCKVIARKGQQYAHYEVGNMVGLMKLPIIGDPKGWAMREIVVLHELAHHLTSSSKYAGHGPEFCKRFLLLIEKNMGLDARNALMLLYIQEGVDVQT